MFTILLTARSWPTIFPRSRRSKSRTSELRISGSSRTSSETKGLTIALYLFSGPSWPSITALIAQSLTYYVQIACQSNVGFDITHVLYFWTANWPFRWNYDSPTGQSHKGYRQFWPGALSK